MYSLFVCVSIFLMHWKNRCTYAMYCIEKNINVFFKWTSLSSTQYDGWWEAFVFMKYRWLWPGIKFTISLICTFLGGHSFAVGAFLSRVCILWLLKVGYIKPDFNPFPLLNMQLALHCYESVLITKIFLKNFWHMILPPFTDRFQNLIKLFQFDI